MSYRILAVAPQPFYEDRGTPISTKHLLEALSDLGIEVDLLTYPTGADIELPGLQIIRPRMGYRPRHVAIGLSFKKVLLDVILTFWLAGRLLTRRYQAIHAIEEAAFPAVVLARRWRVRVIYDMQSSLSEQLSELTFVRVLGLRNLIRRCEKWLIHRVDDVVCSAGLVPFVQQLRTNRVWQWHFPGQAMHDECCLERVKTLQAELGLHDGAKVVLYAGNFERYQGIPLLVDAMRIVRRTVPESVCILVGASDANAVKVQHDAWIKVVPRISRTLLGPYYALADVLVSPRTSGANAPLKIYDYAAARRAIVATDVAAHRPVLSHATAILVPPTPQDLADGIVRSLVDPVYARQLADSAFEAIFARGDFNPLRSLVRDLYCEHSNMPKLK